MAEILTKESETGELEIFTSASPLKLSAEQKENFTTIIRDNSPYLQDKIKELKKIQVEKNINFATNHQHSTNKEQQKTKDA